MEGILWCTLALVVAPVLAGCALLLALVWGSQEWHLWPRPDGSVLSQRVKRHASYRAPDSPTTSRPELGPEAGHGRSPVSPPGIPTCFPSEPSSVWPADTTSSWTRAPASGEPGSMLISRTRRKARPGKPRSASTGR